MKIKLLILFFNLYIALYSQVPVAIHASPETQKLLSYLSKLKGKAIVAGQHNYIQNTEPWEKIYQITGKYPGLWGGDFSYENKKLPTRLNGENGYRNKMVKAAVDAHHRGAIITIMYHQVRPDCTEFSGFNGVKTTMTDVEFDSLLTNGTAMNRAWISRVDTIAYYLKKLQKNKVPVLFRPYHECNGNWFWWGQKKKYAQLYQLLYNRYTYVHKLNNIVWVWSPARVSEKVKSVKFDAYFPGNSYVDILGIDDYDASITAPAFKNSDYVQLIKLSKGKPLAIAETGKIPDIMFLRKHRSRYVYFMVWPDRLVQSNSVESMKATYTSRYVLTTDKVKIK